MRSQTRTITTTNNNNNNDTLEERLTTHNADSQQILQNDDREFYNNMFNNNTANNTVTDSTITTTTTTTTNTTVAEVIADIPVQPTDNLPNPVNASYVLREHQEQMRDFNRNIMGPQLPQQRPRGVTEIIRDAQAEQANIQDHIQDNIQQAEQLNAIRQQLFTLHHNGLALMERITNLVVHNPLTTAALVSITVGAFTWYNRRATAQRVLQVATSAISNTVNRIDPQSLINHTHVPDHLSLHIGPRDAGNVGGILYLIRIVVRHILRR